MAALDSGREKSRALAIRRVQLQIMRHETSIVESEIEIEQKKEEIARFENRIVETKKQIEALRAEIKARLDEQEQAREQAKES